MQMQYRAIVAVAFVALGLAALAIRKVPSERDRATELAAAQLREYAGVKLWQLPENEQEVVARLVDQVTATIGRSERSEFDLYFFNRQNWLVHSDGDRGGRLYVVQMEPAMSIPGSSHCRILIVDGSKSQTRTMQFNVGYRAWPKLASVSINPRGFLCLTVEAVGMWSGGTRQFYRLTDEYVELLRSETLAGSFNMGRGNVFEITKKPPDWAEWKHLLHSREPKQQLRGLAAFWSWDVQEHLAGVDNKTRSRLRDLSGSRDPWIAEASTAAIELLSQKKVSAVEILRRTTQPDHSRSAASTSP